MEVLVQDKYALKLRKKRVAFYLSSLLATVLFNILLLVFEAIKILISPFNYSNLNLVNEYFKLSDFCIL